MSSIKNVLVNCYHQVILLGLLSVVSCTQVNVFENNTNIPNQAWQSSNTATGSFAITDTASLYNMYLILRHTDSYKYNNIWLNVGIQLPGDSMRYNKMTIDLATDASGWMGTGMNDIWELRQLVYLPIKKMGTYKYSIGQIMRDDPLKSVLSVGVRLEKH